MKKFSWIACVLWLSAGCALACQGAEPDAKARARAALALAAQKDSVAMRVKSDRLSWDCGCTSPQDCNCGADCACPNCIPHPTILPSDDGGPPWIWDPVAKEWWRKVPIQKSEITPLRPMLLPPLAPMTYYVPMAPPAPRPVFFGGGGFRRGGGSC